MLRGKMKFYSLFSSFALVALFMAGQLPAFAQTENKTDNKLDKSDLVAKTETPADPVKSKPVWFPRKSSKAPTGSSGWNGLYVGGYAGFSLARATADTSTVVSSTASNYFASTSPPAIATAGRQNLGSTRFTAGGTFGYNHQSGKWVVGAETDFGFLTGTKNVSSTAVYPCCTTTSFTVTQTAKTNWLWTARPRVGYAHGSALYYLTGGLAVTHINYQALFTDTFASAHENGGLIKTDTGWTGGGGVEYKLGGNWSFKGEYLYSDFGRQTVTSTNLTAPSTTAHPDNVFTHSIFLAQHDLRFGINYHF